MAQGLLALLTPAGFSVALIITVVSGLQLYRQKITGFQSIREFLLAVYFLINFLIVLDFIRLEAGSPAFMEFYPALSLTLVFLEGILLLSAAVGMHLRPVGSSYRTLLSDLSKSRLHSFLFYLFVVMTVAAELYYLIFRPYSVVLAYSVSGDLVYSLGLATGSLSAVLMVFAFFLLYPIILLAVGIRRVPNPRIKRSLAFLPPGWAVVATIYVSFQLYSWLYGVDATSIMYPLLAAIFGLVTREFRNGAVLAGFVELAPKEAAAAPPMPSGERVSSISGKKALVEVDPSSPFEGTLSDICSECVAAGRTVFVFTPMASRLYNAVNKLAEVRLFAMSSEASYLKPTQRPNEVQIPKYDVAVLLDTLDRTVTTTAGKEIVVIFDSVSDMILTTSFDKCYKFLKQANEIDVDPRITALFVVLKGVHKENTFNILRSLFQNHFAIDSSQLRLEK